MWIAALVLGGCSLQSEAIEADAGADVDGGAVELSGMRKLRGLALAGSGSQLPEPNVDASGEPEPDVDATTAPALDAGVDATEPEPEPDVDATTEPALDAGVDATEPEPEPDVDATTAPALDAGVDATESEPDAGAPCTCEAPLLVCMTTEGACGCKFTPGAACTP